MYDGILLLQNEGSTYVRREIGEYLNGDEQKAFKRCPTVQIYICGLGSGTWDSRLASLFPVLLVRTSLNPKPRDCSKSQRVRPQTSLSHGDNGDS
jgi:hypothetical protein